MIITIINIIVVVVVVIIIIVFMSLTCSWPCFDTKLSYPT